MRLVGLGLGGVIAVAAWSARADETLAEDMPTALADFAAAEKALSLSAPCDTMCKALQSMVRAADRICELARDGGATDQKKCADARARVADATAKVRAACPTCDPAPPYAPSTTPSTAPPPPVTKGEDKASVGKKATEDADMAPREPAAAYSETVVAGARRTSVTLDVLPFFAPPWMVHGRFERSVQPWLSIAINASYGSLPKNGPEGRGRSSALAIGGEVRGYFIGRFDGFGVFVAADLTHRSAALQQQETVSARTFPVGLALGGVLGTKLVTYGGLTLEARAGASYLLNDNRHGGGARVFPHGGVALGWTF